MLKVIGSQWSNILLRIVSALVLTPFMIHYIGAEGYGAWVFLNAVVGYLSMLQGGLPASSLRHLSEKLGVKDYQGFNNTLASSLSLFTGMSAVMLAVAGILIAISDLVYEAPPSWAFDGRVAFFLATLAIAVTLISNALMTVLEAHDAYLSRNLAEMSGTLVRTGLTVGLVLWRPTLTLVAVAVLAGELVTLVMLAARIPARFGEALPLPGKVDPDMAEGAIGEVANRMADARGEDIVVARVLAQHQLHPFDEILHVAPVALRIEIAEHERRGATRRPVGGI